MEFDVSVPEVKKVKTSVAIGKPKTEDSKTTMPIEVTSPAGKVIAAELGINLAVANSPGGPILEITVSRDGDRFAVTTIDLTAALAPPVEATPASPSSSKAKE